MAESTVTTNVRQNPYFGTYGTLKPVIVQAPDALIFIDEEMSIPVCLECDAKATVKDYVTTISTNLTIDGSGGGSCSFDILVPRHANVRFVRDGKSIISNMMEVEIWFKGAFTVNGMPRYYRSFWGYINQVSIDYGDGAHTISVSCVDMLSWWNIMKFNLNAALIGARVANQKDAITVWASRFRDQNPFQILATLSMVTRLDLVEMRSFFNESVASEDARQVWRQSSDQLIKYWQRRMNKISKAIRVYGMQGQSLFNGMVFYTVDRKTQLELGRSLRTVGDPRTLFGVELTTNQNLFNPFQTLGTPPLIESEKRGRLEIMVSVKDHIGWEFFLDPTGEVVFKPPFYNIDVKQNFPVSWIRDVDILNWNESESEPEATHIDVVGQWGNARLDLEMDPLVSPNGTYRDFNLTRQYGLRVKNLECLWLNNGKACGFKAVDEMSRIAANRFQATVTIPGRPELRLGLPVYIESFDTYWYVNSIQHSFIFGSSFTTTLGLTSRRARFSSTEVLHLNREVVGGSVLNIDENGIGRDEDGRNVGIPNIIMRPATDVEFKSLADNDDPMAIGAPDPNNEGTPKKVPRQGGYEDNALTAQAQSEDWDEQRRGISWNVSGGVWVYDLDDGDEHLLAVKYKPSDTKDPPPFLTAEEAAIPISDSNGYELIGGFSYGRGLLIDDTGSIGSPTGTVDSEGEPVLSLNDQLQGQIDAAVALRNSTPDDEVEVKDGRQTRASIGGGVASEASVMKVDSTNAGETFSDMAPDDGESQICTCVDNYTTDNLLLLQTFSGVFTDVFDQLTNIEDLLTDSYQATTQDVSEHEAIKKTTQTVGNISDAPSSPTISDVDRLLNDQESDSNTLSGISVTGLGEG